MSRSRRPVIVAAIAGAVAMSCGLHAPVAAADYAGYVQQVRFDQPASYWPLQERSGPSVADAADGNTGTAHGTGFGDTGAMAGSLAMDFDGSSSYVEAPSHGLSTPSVTVEAWVKPTTGGFVFSGPEYAYGLSATANGTSFNWRLTQDGVYTEVSSPISLADGRWHHVVGVYDAAIGPTEGQAYLYIDGGLATSRGVTSSEAIYYGNYAFPGAADSWVGQNGGNNDFFGGAVEDVAVYPKALPAGRVVAHFRAAGVGGPGAPRADCFDESTNGQWAIVPDSPNPQFRTPNPADTEPAGSYCAQATSAQGLDGNWNRRATAFAAADAAQHDKVFSFAGHGVNCTDASGDNVLPDSQQTALGMLFADPNENASLLVGSEHSPCLTWTGKAHYDMVFDAPQRFSRVDLVVIQACYSGRDTAVDHSIAHQIADAGAKAVVGFDGELQFPGHYGEHGPTGTQRKYGDAWAAGFWQAIGAGDTVSEAVDAGTAYESYVTGDPNDTYQSGHVLIYGDPNLLVGRAALPPLIRKRAGAWAAAVPNRRLTRALAAFLRHRVRGHVRWRSQPSVRGTEYLTEVPRVGLFVLDSRFTVHEAVLYGRARAGRVVSVSRARRLAAVFAARHGSPLRGLRLRRTTVSGSGRARELAFTWQAARGPAWLPTFVNVRVRADGAIASFARDSQRVRVRVRPRVSSATARSVAQRLASPGVASTTRVDGLAVTSLAGGRQRLVWMVSVRQRAGAAFAPESVVWVNALTGRPV